MDKMSLFSILTVSVPEAIFNIYMAFVLTGQRNRLYLDDRLNILRLITAVPLMVTAAVITRAVVPNMILILLINIFSYTVILKYTYKQKWSDGILCSVIIMGFLVSFESLFVLIYVLATEKNLEYIYINDISRLTITIVERVVQIFIIVSFWKWDLVYLNLRRDKKVLYIFIFTAAILLSTEAICTLVFIYSFPKMSLLFKVMCIIGETLFITFNFLLCKIVIMLAKNLK